MSDTNTSLANAQSRAAARQRGAVLVEFAFISLLMYLIIAVTIDFGRLFFTAQAVQDAARATAREISVIPLPPDMTFEEAMNDPKVRQRVFQPEHLVVNLDNIPGGLTLQQFFDSLPVLNQMLRPLMIFETLPSTSSARRVLRYPGALLTDPSTPSGLTVGIPFVESRGAGGAETIRWVPVIEEIKNPDFPAASPFSMTTPDGMPQRGLVAIRINYPYQAAMMSAYQSQGRPPGIPKAPNLSSRILADDGAVVELNSAPGGFIPDPTNPYGGPYSGIYGLGKMYVSGDAVRPFRRLLTAQMIFRREVFE